MIERLDDANFLLYAAKYYDNPQCYDTLEFYEDLKRFKYIKRLLNRYVKHSELKERLILNHIIALNNVFGPTATVKMLFLKLSGMEQYIKPFLEFLSIMPDIVENIDGENLYTSSIPVDLEIVRRLRLL
jgi:hypothetical protein